MMTEKTIRVSRGNSEKSSTEDSFQYIRNSQPEVSTKLPAFDSQSRALRMIESQKLNSPQKGIKKIVSTFFERKRLST